MGAERPELVKRMELHREQVLELAKESPACVAKHDKSSWLALFGKSGVIEDPVGAAPHVRGTGEAGEADPLERFYETFIAPNKIEMQSQLDVVAEGEVARDVVIHTVLKNGAQLHVAAYLLYKIAPEAGALRIQRLAAHWDLPRMSLQVMTGGLRGFIAMNQVTYRMLRCQGVGGVINYMRGMFQGIFDRGQVAVRKLTDALNHRDPQGVGELFVEHDPIVEWPVGGKPMGPSELLAQLPKGARFAIERPLSAGWVTACRFAVTGGESPGSRGIVFFHFDPVSEHIARARFFVDDAA